MKLCFCNFKTWDSQRRKIMSKSSHRINQHQTFLSPEHSEGTVDGDELNRGLWVVNKNRNTLAAGLPACLGGICLTSAPIYWFNLSSAADDLQYPDNQTIPSRSISGLSFSSGCSGSARGPRCSSSSYLLGLDDSDEEHKQPYLLYQSHLGPSGSQESLSSASARPQVFNPTWSHKRITLDHFPVVKS